MTREEFELISTYVKDFDPEEIHFPKGSGVRQFCNPRRDLLVRLVKGTNEVKLIKETANDGTVNLVTESINTVKNIVRVNK